MNKKLTTLLLVLPLLLIACQTGPLSPTGTSISTATQILPPPAIPSASETPSQVPTATPTLTPTQTETPTPTQTPTLTLTPTHARIDASNAAALQEYESLPASYLRGQILDVRWAPGDPFILLHTTIGLHLLDPQNLEETAFFPGTIPEAISANGILLVSTADTPGWIDLSTQAFLPLDNPEPLENWQRNPVALNSQGTILALVDWDEPDTLQLYQFPEMSFMDRFKITHDKGIRWIDSILFSPEGASLFFVIHRTDQRASLMRLDFDQPEPVVELATELQFDDLTLSHQGNRLAYYFNGLARIRTASAGNLWNTLTGSFSSTVDEKRVFFSSTGQVSFRDSQSIGMAYSYWGANPDSIILVWDIDNGQILNTYDHIPGEVQWFDFAQDGSRFLAATGDGIIRVYEGDGELTAVTEPYDTRGEVDFSPDSSLVAVPAGTGIRLYNPRQERGTGKIGPFPGSTMINVRFVDSDTLAVSVYPRAGDPYTELWDIPSETRIRKYDIGNCQFSANKTRLACESKYIQVLDARQGSITGSFGTANQTFDYQLSPDGNLLAICSYKAIPEDHRMVYSEAIGLWDLQKGSRIRNLLMDGPACGKMGFSVSGKYLVSAAGGIWDVADGNLVGSFESQPYNEVVMSQNDSLALVGRNLVEIPSGRPLGSIGYSGNPLSLRFTSDGFYLAVMTDQVFTFWGVLP